MHSLRVLTKTALQRENAGILSKATADTVGQVGGLLSLNPVATRDLSTMRKSDSPEQHELIDAVAKLDDHSLSDVVVRPGGYNLIRDIPRVFTNKRTSLLGKLYGAGTLPLTTLVSNLRRSNAYDPYTNTVVTYGNNPGVTLHELGHAQDFNSEPLAESWLGRQRAGLRRDLYGMGRGLAWPFGSGITLTQEHRAWTHGEETLKKLLKEKLLGKETEELALSTLANTKGPALGSYWGGAAAPALPGLPVSPLTGMLAGWADRPNARIKAIRKAVEEENKPESEDGGKSKTEDEQKKSAVAKYSALRELNNRQPGRFA